MMDEFEFNEIKQIITNLESAMEKLNDLNNQLNSSPQLYNFKLFGESMTLIKNAKTIAYGIVT